MSNSRSCALILMVAVCACGEERTADDVPTAGREGTFRMSLAEEARIDGMAADLVPIGAVAVAEDGSIAVTQRQDHAVRFFSATGAPLGSVGREGSGPGEFRLVNHMGWLSDTLWVSDFMQNRVTLIAPNRTFVRTVNLPARTRPGGPAGGTTFGFLSTYALYSDESMLAIGQSEESTALLHITWGGDLVKVVTRLSGLNDVDRVVGSDGSVANTNMFPSTPRWALSPDGHLAAIARTDIEGSAGVPFRSR